MKYVCFFFSFTVLMTMTSRRPTKASPRRLTITTITPPPCSRRPRPLTSPQCQPFRGRPPPRPPPPARPPPALQHHSCSFSLTASRTYPSILPPCPSCRRSPTPMLWVRWWTCPRTSFRATEWVYSPELPPSLRGAGSLPTRAWPPASSLWVERCRSRVLFPCRWLWQGSRGTASAWPTAGATWALITPSLPAALTGDARRRRERSNLCGSATACFLASSRPSNIPSQTSSLSPSAQRHPQRVPLLNPCPRRASNASRGQKVRRTRWKSSRWRDRRSADSWHTEASQTNVAALPLWTAPVNCRRWSSLWRRWWCDRTPASVSASAQPHHSWANTRFLWWQPLLLT